MYFNNKNRNCKFRSKTVVINNNSFDAVYFGVKAACGKVFCYFAGAVAVYCGYLKPTKIEIIANEIYVFFQGMQ